MVNQQTCVFHRWDWRSDGMACGNTTLPPGACTEITTVDGFCVSVDRAPPVDLDAFDICTGIPAKPYGVIRLVSAARHFASASGHPIRVERQVGDTRACFDRVGACDILSWPKRPSVRMHDRAEHA